MHLLCLWMIMYWFWFYCLFLFFFFKQKTAYEMRISDWSSDVCSSDLVDGEDTPAVPGHANPEDLDISGIDVERHESARAPVDAVVAQEDAVLARLHRGMHKAVLLHGADVLVVDIDFGLHASGDQERGFPAHVDASLFRKRIEIGRAHV